MILAIDRHDALYIFDSTQAAEQDLEAIDVQQDAFEFCDAHGQRYVPLYTHTPKVTQLGPIGFADIGVYKLKADGVINVSLPDKFIGRARHVEHTSIPAITSIQALRDELQKRA